MAHGSLDGMACTTRDLALCFLLAALLYSTIGQTTVPRLELEPEFLAPLENHTVIQGRDVFFTCVVNHLQSYKVAWIKSDSRAILAMHTHMVAPNPRLYVTHNGHNTWKLHVHNVQSDDSGTYMCQVNTDPMRSLIGHMKVVIPPDIMDQDEAFDQPMSMEHGEVLLSCRATGNPRPEVTWRREDGRPIVLRAENPRGIAVKTYKSEQLHLVGVLRQEMGQYLCIASNGVPPSVSKRYYVNVLFKPAIKIRDQVVYAHINSDVTFECTVESSPKSLTTWYTENALKVAIDERHAVKEFAVNDYTYQVNLTIRKLRSSDFRAYTCFTENSFGKTSATVRLREHQKEKATSSPSLFIPRKSSSGKHRKGHSSLNSDSRKSSNRFSYKDEMTLIRDDIEKDEEEVDSLERIDAKYSTFPGAPGAHYDSTNFPGSRYLNSAATTRLITMAVMGYLTICAFVM